MGCCESVYVEYSHEYVTEEGSDGGIPRTPDAVFAGVESASCSSSDTIDSATPLRPREDTEVAFQKSQTLNLHPAPPGGRRNSLRPVGSPATVTPKLSKSVDEDGVVWINDYVLVKTIGRGTYGKVKLGIHAETGEQVAIKICNKTLLAKKRKGGFLAGNFLQDVRREIVLLKRVNHPNIVRLLEIIDDEDHDKIYIVMEYVPGGPLMKGVVEQEPLDFQTARRYVRDIINGLEYLHAVHIIHRDIKPENLLLSENGIKISDFNVSHLFVDDDLMDKTEGSPAFLAPEIVSGGKFHGRAVDIWALGVTLWIFIFGTCPFMAENEFLIYDQIRDEEPVFPYDVEPELRDLLLRLLDKNADTRITIEELQEDAWITMKGAWPMDPQDLPDEPIEPTDTEIQDAFINASSPSLAAGTPPPIIEGPFTYSYETRSSELSNPARAIDFGGEEV